jgi:hypothetical protein
MSDTMYSITAKCYDKVDIHGFIVSDKDGNKRVVKKQDAVKLARAGKFENAKTIIDTSVGEYIISIDGRYEGLDTTFKNSSLKLELICRLIDSNGKCIGYKARDNTGKTYNLSIGKTWELACNNNVVGVRAVINNNVKAIVSTEALKLDSLPKMNS